MAKKIKKKSLARRLIKWFAALVILCILGALFYFIALPMLKASVTTSYDEYQASKGTISNSLSFSGSVNVVNSEYLTASESATVREIYIEDGSDVKKGDKLMRLSSGETIKANFDGSVNVINVEPGDSVGSNTQLCQIVDFTNMKVTMRVDEYDISQVYVGQECTVTVTALEKSFSSSISHINRLSASSGSVAYYTVTATVEVTQDVLAGMQVTVTIPKEEAKDVVVLKMDAISFDADNSAFVYVMDENGVMQKRYIEVGVNNGNYAEIKSGLSEGETVYVETEEEVTAAGGLQELLGGLMGGREINRSNSSGQRGTNEGGFAGNARSMGGNAADRTTGGASQRGGSR